MDFFEIGVFKIRGPLRTKPKIYDGASLGNLQKSSIVDVRLSSKYAFKIVSYFTKLSFTCVIFGKVFLYKLMFAKQSSTTKHRELKLIINNNHLLFSTKKYI